MIDEGGYFVGSRQVHHYVAQMNLGRFSVEPDRENPPLCILESNTGRIRKSSVRNEAAVTDYNRLDDSDGGHEPELAEQAFSEIETLARPVLDKISARDALTPPERISLAAFLQLQYQRTPRMRENMRFIQREGARLWAQMKLSDREHVRSFLESEGRTPTDEEIDAWSSDLRKLIDSGEIAPSLGWNAEVLGQFAMADNLPARLCAEMTWNIICADGTEEFIISDHPVHIYDPVAQSDRNGGWFSSPYVQVTFPVDRDTCLLLHPGPDLWYEIKADSAMVRDLNLRRYASAEWRSYGSTQRVLERVWSASKKHPKLIDTYRPKPPQMIFLEQSDERSGSLRESSFIKGPETPGIRRFKRTST
jgi:Protein of unknown function (DUF4238)